jgi:hypothetical protein
LLNGFGRAFKSAGFTMMGAQGKIEGEHLDIPNVLNLGVFATTYVQSQSNNYAANAALNGSAVGAKWGVPGTGGELSLFAGGRISEFAGFLTELGMGGGGAAPAPVAGALVAGGAVAASAKLALLFPVGDARVGAVIHSSNNQGVAYSFELLNTGAANTHKLMGNPGMNNQHVRAYSASQYFNTNTAATGVSVVANNSMGFIVLGAYEAAGNNLVAGANTLPLTYIRAAATIDLAGFDAGFGIQNFGGSSTVSGANTKLTVIDAQLQGEIASMAAGFYASYGRAPSAAMGAATLAPVGVTFNASPNQSSSFNVAAEIGVIPRVVTVQVAGRLAKQGGATIGAPGLTDNALMLGVTYELAQNLGLSLHRTMQTGGLWNAVAGVEPAGKTATTLLLETAF